ncbi:MAG: ACT domain-containing protein [Candidatus Omnitrophica bacterium]|nr:ACT domain-containing protein [Candidatus Omnitrophota bacterium]
MPIQKQLSIFLPNRPGMLAHMAGFLAEANVNILALSVHDTVDNAVVRLVLDNPTKATLLLEQEELYIMEQDVVILAVDNEPGILAKIAQKLGHADINIQYAYCTAAPNQQTGCIVIKTDQPEAAMECLRDLELG